MIYCVGIDDWWEFELNHIQSVWKPDPIIIWLREREEKKERKKLFFTALFISVFYGSVYPEL